MQPPGSASTATAPALLTFLASAGLAALGSVLLLGRRRSLAVAAGT